MAYHHAYVFAADASGKDALAGELNIDARGGEFRYSDTWLATSWAYALDPANLPLSPRAYRCDLPSGVFGVFSDAAADDWGMRLLLQHHKHAPSNEIERLLLSSGRGVGCLRFSLARSRPKPAPLLPTLDQLQQLATVAERAERRELLSAAELALLEPGSSMGGARPKVSVRDADGAWLLKFSRPQDLVDMAKLEYATMRFARDYFHLNVGELRLFELGDGKVAYGIRRFDCPRGQPHHFISAHSLFNSASVRLVQDSLRNPYSYVHLATLLRKHAHDFKRDCIELFRRMVANILLGNTDDHARNHAWLYNIQSSQWRLAPLYDVVPIVGSRAGKQALGVGKIGADSTLANALSYCQQFGLSIDTAKQHIDEMLAQLTHWERHCEECGLTAQEIMLSKQCLLVNDGSHPTL